MLTTQGQTVQFRDIRQLFLRVGRQANNGDFHAPCLNSDCCEEEILFRSGGVDNNSLRMHIAVYVVLSLH